MTRTNGGGSPKSVTLHGPVVVDDGRRTHSVASAPAVLAVAVSTPHVPLQTYMTAAEERYLTEVLTHCRWNARDAARLLGTPYSTLWKKLKRYGLTRWHARGTGRPR